MVAKETGSIIGFFRESLIANEDITISQVLAANPSFYRVYHKASTFLIHRGFLIAKGNDRKFAWQDDLFWSNIYLCEKGTSILVPVYYEAAKIDTRHAKRCVDSILGLKNNKTLAQFVENVRYAKPQTKQAK